MDLSNRTMLVTGGTAGIGKETARGLARLGARVLIVGRDPGRARSAAAELAADTANPRIEAFTADVTSLAGLRDLAARPTGPIDVLVNNVGAMTARRETTADGVERMFAAHVLAPFVLTHLLLDRMPPGARVVNVTGGIPGGPVDPANLQAERRFLGWTFSQYNHTKTALMAMSHRLAERLRPHGVRVNVVYPGHGHTPMNRAVTVRAFPYLYRPVAPLVKLLAPVLFGDLSRPARSSVHLAASPEVADTTGTYFGQDLRPRPWPDSVLDERVRDAVWTLCERLSGCRSTA
ncbi:SDR family NAD(P)-dependent oxidoreductase [Actinomadura kijaniata]|uniref:SDR family NAD(P)-dependent oxidoreductase n=1 Tax=Actinomadura kijaniata TaxID=46161 RepID=UPI003F1C4F76